MAAFFIKQRDESLIDAIIRANDENDARRYAADGELIELRDNVAIAMGVPTEVGRHNGALSRWLLNPTNWLGEPLARNRG
jgi:hypothetical protein